MIQSFDVDPVHVWHRGEHGVQEVPLEKLPSGQTVPPDVTDWGATHFVRSFAFWVNPVLQEMQSPVLSAHCEHPSWHTGGTISIQIFL